MAAPDPTMRRGCWRWSRLVWVSPSVLALALAGCGKGGQTDAAPPGDVGADRANPASDGPDAARDSGAQTSPDAGADGLDAGGETRPDAGDAGADVSSVAEPPVDAAGMDRVDVAADSATDRAPDAPTDSAGDRVDGPSDVAASVDRVFADAFDTRYPSIKVAQISIGWSSMSARMEDGTVRGWGSNYQNALGFPKVSPYELRPVAVPNLTGVIAIDAAEISFGCAIPTGGNAVCWGNNNEGQLGDGTISIRDVPTPVVDLGGPVAELITGGWFACARLMDSTMKCWGSNSYGQLGFWTSDDVLRPTAVPGVTGVTQMAAGQSHTCVLLADRTVSCWGLNGAGQLGDGTTLLNRYQSMPVPGLSDIVQIAADYTGTCALGASGAVWCWGDNREGEAGDGSVTEKQLVPARALITDAVRIAAGDSHNCALLRNGTVKCWGSNRYGQLGDGTAVGHPTPEPVMAIADAVDIDARGPNTCVILTDRSLRCWGWNSSGQLGNGGMANSWVPIEPAW